MFYNVTWYIDWMVCSDFTKMGKVMKCLGVLKIQNTMSGKMIKYRSWHPVTWILTLYCLWVWLVMGKDAAEEFGVPIYTFDPKK